MRWIVHFGNSVRAARPDVWLAVDANQAYSLERLEDILPHLIEARVSLIEQPFPMGEEHQLEGLSCPIPIAADESVQTSAQIAVLVGRVCVINIKLDKCGGLTEALRLVAECRRNGLGIMVGNMGGTSLAIAPATLVGQFCDVVDLDGPIFLASDRQPSVSYASGRISVPPGSWGCGGLSDV
jgi:L-Ala-D/L-Glu epimerase